MRDRVSRPKETKLLRHGRFSLMLLHKMRDTNIKGLAEPERMGGLLSERHIDMQRIQQSLPKMEGGVLTTN